MGLKKIAIVIDTSSSMDNFIHVFQLDAELHPINLKFRGGANLEELWKLAKEYDQIWFFTDGLIAQVKPNWKTILSDKFRIINTEKL